ncbi:hypothetical protein CKM354_000611800 [Cercospora kikuchii]|uniref:Uncharacterized protein n=1 Tax=Cercospora kikuchii TaxID=84275 RepID=A0A9P3CR07_9PEZI|nr:uncharacterized protein CKM354_000611800 [Cercospora kikuchii]GIZ42868.1 hypothetical protein CKM354_000611800 [Cercospora kikuchii]
MDSELKPPLVIFTYPRSASNLLLRMLSLPEQGNVVSVESGGYFFMPAIWKLREMGLLNRPSSDWTATEIESLHEIYSTCAKDLESLLEKSMETGKRVIFKEHSPFGICPYVQSAYLQKSEIPDHKLKLRLKGWPSRFTRKTHDSLPPNDTVLVSDFLGYCAASFLIRHPALAFPSYYRMTKSILAGDLNTVTPALTEVFTLKWTRDLYDWFLKVRDLGEDCQKLDPIVLDADDLIETPNLLLHYCEVVGLDPSKVQFQWAPATRDQLDNVPKIRLHSRSTLYASSGIVGGKTFRGMSIETELENWKNEFGSDVAAQLHRFVMDALPDYEYLFARRIQMPPKSH